MKLNIVIFAAGEMTAAGLDLTLQMMLRTFVALVATFDSAVVTFIAKVMSATFDSRNTDFPSTGRSPFKTLR